MIGGREGGGGVCTLPARGVSEAPAAGAGNIKMCQPASMEAFKRSDFVVAIRELTLDTWPCSLMSLFSKPAPPGHTTASTSTSSLQAMRVEVAVS